MAVLFLALVYRYADSKLALRAPEIISRQQMTVNGQEKWGLVTDGKTLYMGQEQGGWYALTAMPVEGGAIHVLWTPQANVEPVDVSPDGRKLLALTWQGVEQDRELWIVPLDQGVPRRLANITAHSAAFAPDGQTIAYASGTGIYLTTEAQPASRRIGVFTAVPNKLFWSQDGHSLRFVLDEIATAKDETWGVISGDRMQTVTVRSMPASLDGNGFWAPVAGSDNCYIAGNQSLQRGSSLWLAHFGNSWWESPLRFSTLHPVVGNVEAIAYATGSSRLFVLSEPQDRTAFARFDARTREFQIILPGVSGAFPDYSRDGRWVAYVSFRENSLWVSRADGSATRQITFPPDTVELPRWSPDGRQIAYMSQSPGRPWRIYIQQFDSGAVREASTSEDSQGAPTWSPDGRYIAYGNVRCESTGSCAIHRIDVSTGTVNTLPDSEGLFTARWSPDGRWIAAIHLEKHELMLFDVKSRRWRKLADGITGSDLSWSADSKFLYANILGAEASIVRIRATDGVEATVLDLRSQDKFDLVEGDDLQFSLAPDDSVILHRRVHSSEVYAYDLRER
jgi:Tol biopolymer transport system component